MVGWFWVCCLSTLVLAGATGGRWVLWLPAFGVVALIAITGLYEPDKLPIALAGSTLYGTLLAGAAMLVIAVRRRIVSSVPVD